MVYELFVDKMKRKKKKGKEKGKEKSNNGFDAAFILNP